MTNLLQNGGFDGNLYRWSGTGAIDRANGYPRLGCASLAAGQVVTSDVIGLGENYPHTVHFFYRVSALATLTVSYGAISQTLSGSPADIWREGVMSFALDSGGNSGVSFAVSGGACMVDSVTLQAGGLVAKRSDLASMVAARLRTLASDAGLGSTASDAGPEGDYSLAIDEALRAVGAVNSWGDPDVTALDKLKINDAVDAARSAMLVVLQTGYALKTDVSLGPRRESFSQIAGNIGGLLGGGGGKGGVGTGKLSNGDWPR